MTDVLDTQFPPSENSDLTMPKSSDSATGSRGSSSASDLQNLPEDPALGAIRAMEARLNAQQPSAAPSEDQDCQSQPVPLPPVNKYHGHCLTPLLQDWDIAHNLHLYDSRSSKT